MSGAMRPSRISECGIPFALAKFSPFLRILDRWVKTRTIGTIATSYKLIGGMMGLARVVHRKSGRVSLSPVGGQFARCGRRKRWPTARFKFVSQFTPLNANARLEPVLICQLE